MTALVPVTPLRRVRLIRTDAPSRVDADAKVTIMIGDVTATMTLSEWSRLLANPERTTHRPPLALA